MVAEEITEVDWQMWVDQLSREGLSRSRIANHVSVASSIYAWACRPAAATSPATRCGWSNCRPTTRSRGCASRWRPRPSSCLAVLSPEDRVPYAIAFYAGLRRAEIHRLEWPEVLDDGKIASHILVLRSKSEAGTQRRPPIAEPLQQILREAWLRQGRPTTGSVVRALGDVGQARRAPRPRPGRRPA